jgi:hypothetical protein
MTYQIGKQVKPGAEFLKQKVALFKQENSDKLQHTDDFKSWLNLSF